MQCYQAMEDFQDPQYCVQQFHDCRNLAQVKRAIQAADEAWTEAFIERGGLDAILACLSVLGEQDVDVSLSDAMPRLEVVACLRAVMNCRYGLESLARRGGREGSHVGKIALALNTNNMLLKIQLFLVLSAISKHSKEGLQATLDALDYYKTELCLRHRYSVLVQELTQTTAYPECQATVMAFINYLLSSLDDLQQRMRLRSELNALDLTDILGIMRYSDNAALSEQVQLYEAGVVRDREQSAMPGGVDITDHQQLFTALFEKVFGTPNSTKLLGILQKMLLIDRDTPIGDVAWSGLERMTEAALKMHTEQQAERIATSEIDHLRKALEAEAARKEREIGDKNAPKPAMDEITDTTSSDPNTASTCSGGAGPIAAPPTVAPPPPPPPPPPSFGPQKTVAEIRTAFDKARVYKPNKRMKKLNWEKAPECDARQPATVWYKTVDVNHPVRVSVSESHIESLFCQTMEGTDGKVLRKSTKTHLPDQRKALNINIVLDGMKKVDPNDPEQIRRVHMSTDEVLCVVRDGNASLMTLNQATVLMEKAPSEEDRAFLEPFLDDPDARDKLGKVEQFLLGLLTIPAYSERLRVLRTKKWFEELETDYQPIFILLQTAIKELMSSSSLRDLFHIILLTGNFINGNTRLGSAYGFRISSLPRLSTTLANVKKTTLNINFLHFLVTVCEKDCPRLLNFHTELPHLDTASRVSVDEIQEELKEWQKEVDKVKEMMSSLDGRAEDFLLQLQEFVSSAEATLSALNGELAAVQEKGKELARYFCDNRDNFLKSVFVEIKNFSDEFSLTVKETAKEKPIWLSPDPDTTDGSTPVVLSPQPVTSAPSSTETDKPSVRHGLSRATSVVTAHVIDFSSLAPITEEADQAIPRVSAANKNPFVFPSNGHVQESNGSPGIAMGAPAEIVITDVEEVDFHEQGATWEVSNVPQGKGRDAPPQMRTEQDASHLVRHKSSITGLPPPSRSRRVSNHELCRPGITMLSRQASWNEFKGHSPPLRRHGGGWGGDLERYPSSAKPQTIFDGSLDEVAKLLHKMAEAIEKDMEK